MYLDHQSASASVAITRVTQQEPANLEQPVYSGDKMPIASGPLTGLKVLDLSIIVAGGTATSLLADFGAEVIKVERPGAGDPLRNWGPFANGVSLWWKVHSRNKKSITLNLAQPEGQDLLKKLAEKADLLVEGFRPGAMERWGLGPEDLHRANPRLIMVRFSGFGQTGPYKDRPGFGTIAECMSGYVAMTGFVDSPPVLPPIPLADEISGVFGAMAGMMALYHRDASNGHGAPDADARRGQVIDVSLLGLATLGALPPRDRRVAETVGAVRRQLWLKTSIGGCARYQDDRYQRTKDCPKDVADNPWFISTLWLGEYFIASAESLPELHEALPYLEWCVENALPSGVLSEQVHPVGGRPLSVSPLTWSHSAFVWTVLQYVEKFNSLQE